MLISERLQGILHNLLEYLNRNQNRRRRRVQMLLLQLVYLPLQSHRSEEDQKGSYCLSYESRNSLYVYSWACSLLGILNFTIKENNTKKKRVKNQLSKRKITKLLVYLRGLTIVSRIKSKSCNKRNSSLKRSSNPFRIALIMQSKIRKAED